MTDLTPLLELIERLRSPDGCPWDREQSLLDVRAYLLEEAHEAAAAIDAGDRQELAGELGDLLFQVCFVLVLAREEGSFEPAAVIEGIRAKMIARHPHVFGGEQLADAEAVSRAWERRKLAEREGRSILEGVAPSLPALLAAYRMTQKAAAVGFDWPSAGEVLAKVREEIGELEEALAEGSGEDVREELGDLLFTVANLARKLGHDPEATLAAANEKFRRRFGEVERGLAREGRKLGEASLEEMDRLWEESKRR